MSRLYRYADSNDKAGLYLLDGYKGQNTTFQVSRLAEKLFYHLEYEPAIRSQKQGPRIPDKLHWGLFEAGWVYTNASGIAPPTNEAGEIVVEGDSVEITEEIANALESFFEETEAADEDIEELVATLNLDLSPSDTTGNEVTTSSQTTFCDIPDSRCEEIAEEVTKHFEKELNTEEWDITYVSAGRINDETDQHQIIIKTVHQQGAEVQYFHKAIFYPENGLQTVWTTANIQINWNQRAELEKQRGQIIQSIISVTTSGYIDIGEPTSDLTLTTEYGPSIEQF
ncbi:uncharacterized protein Nmlp_1740 [Natronomonas moolapensis 8.8.11]|uniref:Uncharacterized protein n=1 Tax=Natronomonas moolapensis (strain DSM 18674 / CECT 7526 / JCM 14361 / 8.8.11) TaxID=268739 RepID=M1XPL2_NATM8|nr:uncharacterized protein Nmlp_1740 [Natronomonas moolapensis 8.8.11]